MNLSNTASIDAVCTLQEEPTTSEIPSAATSAPSARSRSAGLSMTAELACVSAEFTLLHAYSLSTADAAAIESGERHERSAALYSWISGVARSGGNAPTKACARKI